MTLADVRPPLRTSPQAQMSADLWPKTARRVGVDLHVGGASVGDIAEQFGTPCYVLDEVDVRQRCRDYRAAFGDEAVSYAARAFVCRPLLRTD